MVDSGIMEDVVKTEVGEDTSVGEKNDQPFALLLRVMQLNGKPLHIGGFTGQVMSPMLHEVDLQRSSGHEQPRGSNGIQEGYSHD